MVGGAARHWEGPDAPRVYHNLAPKADRSGRLLAIPLSPRSRLYHS